MQQAKFQIGQIIEHKLFGYRGVIFEVDPVFSLSDEWYEQVARSRPPKDAPWYQVLVDKELHTTYVAEQNLISTEELTAIHHPALKSYFSDFKDGVYVTRQLSM
ncbi:MAG: heat shock protein HspQ [Gammaproteobacteria bacterium]|nr:heat shock protein HspQ [Gammaproteobacteria bacterium]